MALSKTLILAQQVTSVKERELLVRPLPLEFCIQFYIYIYLDLALVGVIIIFGSLFTRFEVTESASKIDLKVQSNCQTKLSFSKSLIQTVQRTFQTCSNTFFKFSSSFVFRNPLKSQINYFSFCIWRHLVFLPAIKFCQKWSWVHMPGVVHFI